jgi:hypothetical protein
MKNEDKTEFTHTATCYDRRDFIYTLVKHFDLMNEHIKKHFNQPFVSNICVDKKFFEKFSNRPDAINRIYSAIYGVYDIEIDKYCSHAVVPCRIGDHFCNEFAIRFDGGMEYSFKFWVIDLFKGKAKDIGLYDL